MEKLLNDYKISFTKGDTYALAVKFKNITDDLSSAYFTVKENADDEPLIQKSLGAGVSKIDDRTYKQEKTYKIQLQSEDTANLEPLVQYLYDFRVAFGNVVQTILSGVFVVKHSISDVSTTSTTTFEVALADVIESEVQTTPPTSGIEYEQDPVACAKIGNLTELNTTQKGTVVGAVNEVVAKNTATQGQVTKILNGTTPVPKATNATNAVNAEKATNATNAGTARVAQYASADTSKGTIEQRLTNLGFKSGNFAVPNGNVTENTITRQGNYVIGKLAFSEASIAGEQHKKTDQYGQTSYWWTLEIPVSSTNFYSSTEKPLTAEKLMWEANFTENSTSYDYTRNIAGEAKIVNNKLIITSDTVVDTYLGQEVTYGDCSLKSITVVFGYEADAIQ